MHSPHSDFAVCKPDLGSFLERAFKNAWTDTGSVPVNIRAGSDEIVVTASIPGVEKDEIAVDIGNRGLSIQVKHGTEEKSEHDGYSRREFSVTSAARFIRLPHGLERSKATSGYKNGILTVTIPRSEEGKEHSISVE